MYVAESITLHITGSMIVKTDYKIQKSYGGRTMAAIHSQQIVIFKICCGYLIIVSESLLLFLMLTGNFQKM